MCTTEEKKFQMAATFFMKWEGGYVNDPSDPGGETNYGIAKRDHPNVDIKNLTVAGALEIYRKEYWDSVHCGSLDPPLAVAAVDTAINCGVSRALSWLLDSGYDANRFIDLRVEYYKKIGTGKLAKFLTGWLNRSEALRTYISKLPQD